MQTKLDSVLIERCSMTKAQIESLSLQSRVLKGEITGKEAASLRNETGVSLGAYYRVVGQARQNATAALFTVLLCVRLKLMKVQDLHRFLDMAEKMPSQLDHETSDEVISLLEALVGRLVTL